MQLFLCKYFNIVSRLARYLRRGGANYHNFADIYRKRNKNMRRVRLTEGQLHNVIRESVNNILNEGFMDKMKGAYQGFRKGQDQMDNDQQNQHQKQQLLDTILNYSQQGEIYCENLMDILDRSGDGKYIPEIKEYIINFFQGITIEVQKLQKIQ